MDDVSRIGTRLTTTATTGWTDWFHGALWLFSDGILRVPIGRIKSVCFVGYMAERHNPLTKVFSIEDFHTLLANPRNLWIPRADITSASLHYSPRVVYELHVQ